MARPWMRTAVVESLAVGGRAVISITYGHAVRRRSRPRVLERQPHDLAALPSPSRRTALPQRSVRPSDRQHGVRALAGSRTRNRGDLALVGRWRRDAAAHAESLGFPNDLPAAN